MDSNLILKKKKICQPKSSLHTGRAEAYIKYIFKCFHGLIINTSNHNLLFPFFWFSKTSVGYKTCLIKDICVHFKCVMAYSSSFPSRLHAHRRRGRSAEAPGCAPWGPAGLRGRPAPGGPPPGGQAAHDPPPAPPDLHQGRATLLQHQAGWQSPNAQTVPGAAGSQGLRMEGQPVWISLWMTSCSLTHTHTLTHTHPDTKICPLSLSADTSPYEETSKRNLSPEPLNLHGLWRRALTWPFCFGEDADGLTWPPYDEGKKIFPFKTLINHSTVNTVNIEESKTDALNNN